MDVDLISMKMTPEDMSFREWSDYLQNKITHIYGIPVEVLEEREETLTELVILEYAG